MNDSDRSNQPSVLCVDDDPRVLNSLKRTLEPFGWRVFTEERGKKAIALLEREDVNVLICDAAMPEMNGIEVLVAAAQIAPATARILLSAHCNRGEVVMAAVNEGKIFRVLSKPWDNHEIRKAVVEAIGMTIQEWHEHRPTQVDRPAA